MTYQLVYYWPDGTWCYRHELSQMTHKSDDYGEAMFPEDFDEHMIDKEVRFLNGEFS